MREIPPVALLSAHLQSVQNIDFKMHVGDCAMMRPWVAVGSQQPVKRDGSSPHISDQEYSWRK